MSELDGQEPIPYELTDKVVPVQREEHPACTAISHAILEAVQENNLRATSGTAKYSCAMHTLISMVSRIQERAIDTLAQKAASDDNLTDLGSQLVELGELLQIAVFSAGYQLGRSAVPIPFTKATEALTAFAVPDTL